MSLGYGCPWKNVCMQKADNYQKKNYCDSDNGWRNCPNRPMNAGNEDVQKRYSRRKANHSDANLGKLLIIGAIVLIVLYWLL